MKIDYEVKELSIVPGFGDNIIKNNILDLRKYTKLTKLNCIGLGLKGIVGIPSTVLEIKCSENHLTELPELPEGLVRLTCEKNQLTQLPNLPKTLKRLICNMNKLENLPELPNSLEALECNHNQLESLPNLPSKLNEFACENNHITNIGSFSPKLRYLNCSNNQLTELPPINSPYVTRIYCNNNQLTSLPNVPKILLSLNCDNNQLTELPSLSHTVSFKELYCNNNQLTELPTLPLSIEKLHCMNNQIKALPEKLSTRLTELLARDNPLPAINFVKKIPTSLKKVDVELKAKVEKTRINEDIKKKVYAKQSKVPSLSALAVFSLPTQAIQMSRSLYSVFPGDRRQDKHSGGKQYTKRRVMRSNRTRSRRTRKH